MQIQNHSLKRFVDMPVSDDFKTRAASMGLTCLQDVLNLDVRQLKAHSQFNYIWYTELLNVLKHENLLDKFQEKLLE